jgi:tRNA A37 threonylcarbamoyladenosine dehydratase
VFRILFISLFITCKAKIVDRQAKTHCVKLRTRYKKGAKSVVALFTGMELVYPKVSEMMASVETRNKQEENSGGHPSNCLFVDLGHGV